MAALALLPLAPVPLSVSAAVWFLASGCSLQVFSSLGPCCFWLPWLCAPWSCFCSLLDDAVLIASLLDGFLLLLFPLGASILAGPVLDNIHLYSASLICSMLDDFVLAD